MKVKRKFPWRMLLHPGISWDLNSPYSSVWFIYWQMVWEWDDHTLPPWERKIEKFFGISFLPD